MKKTIVAVNTVSVPEVTFYIVENDRKYKHLNNVYLNDLDAYGTVPHYSGLCKQVKALLKLCTNGSLEFPSAEMTLLDTDVIVIGVM